MRGKNDRNIKFRYFAMTMNSVKKPLHICIFGEERSIHTRRWVLGLRELGHRVDLVTLIKENEYDIGGISLGAKGKLSYLTKISKLRSIVAELNPDIFHAHHASSFGFLASFVDHPRKILSVWGNDVIVFPFQNRIFRYFINRAISKAHKITATSIYLKDTVKKIDPSVENISVIPFGVDIEQFMPSKRSKSGYINIGIAKSLFPKYGIDILLKAFYSLCKSYNNLHLYIAGKGVYEDEYKKLSITLGISEKVDFKGFINHDELMEFYSKLDIFVMPSTCDGESFGVAAIEASAAGLPVVASRVGGVPEVIVDGKTGFLVEKNNVDQLSSALSKLIESKELRESMGREGRLFVENTYQWQDNLNEMSDLYYEMASNK